MHKGRIMADSLAYSENFYDPSDPTHDYCQPEQ